MNVNQKVFATSSREYWDGKFNYGRFKTYTQKPSSDFIATNNNDGTYSVEVYRYESKPNNIVQYEYYTTSKAYKRTIISNYEQRIGEHIGWNDNNSRIIKLSNTKIVELQGGYVYSSERRTDGLWDVVVFITDYTVND